VGRDDLAIQVEDMDSLPLGDTAHVQVAHAKPEVVASAAKLCGDLLCQQELDESYESGLVQLAWHPQRISLPAVVSPNSLSPSSTSPLPAP